MPKRASFVAILAAALVAPAAFASRALAAEVDIMSYNVAWGRPYGDRLDDVAGVIARSGADVVGVQQVRRFAGWNLKGGPYDCSDQPKKLAEMLAKLTGKKWYHMFAKNYGGRVVNGLCVGKTTYPHEEGVAILSKFPIVSTAVHRLSYDRALAQAKLALPDGRTVTVFTVHLDSAYDYKRVAQASQVSSIVRGAPGRRVLTGDMNAKPGTTVHTILKSIVMTDTWLEKGLGTGATRNARIDYVFYRTSLSLNSVRVIQEWASDHRPVMARFYLQ